MRITGFSGLLGIALAGSVGLAACGDGNDKDADDGGAPATTVVKSGEGESCSRSDDCETGLACFNLTCVDDPTPPMGGSGGTSGNAGSSGRGGSGGSANPGRLSGNGESCTKTSDCEPNLSCFNLRCLAQPTGEGGDQNIPDPPPVLGARGETCVLSSDCQDGLVCLPAGGQTGAVGVCTPKNSGLEPTGKTCAAECAEDEDCCELPIEEHGLIGVKSCSELGAVLEGVDCAASVDPTELRRCFAQSAYCDCDDENPWQCEAGSCMYDADCSASGTVPDGCPQYSRSGMQLTTLCDAGGSDKCRATALCEEDADCTLATVSDDVNDVCAEGECVCHEARCLRECDRDLDCAAGKVCDDDAAVCMPAGMCTGDATCQRLFADARAVCNDNDVCTLGCASDADCNALTGGTFANVCFEGSCVPLGCDSDDECALETDPPGSRRRMFCAEPAEGAATGSSAITD
jgi:hypothetical protein